MSFVCVCVFARFSALPLVCCSQWFEISNILFAPVSRIIRTVWCATENKYCALKLHKIYNYNFHAHEHSNRSPFNSHRFDLYVQPPARIFHLLLGWLFFLHGLVLHFSSNWTKTVPTEHRITCKKRLQLHTHIVLANAQAHICNSFNESYLMFFFSFSKHCQSANASLFLGMALLSLHVIIFY